MIVATRDPWQFLAPSSENPEVSGNHVFSRVREVGRARRFPTQVVQKIGQRSVVDHRVKKQGLPRVARRSHERTHRMEGSRGDSGRTR